MTQRMRLLGTAMIAVAMSMVPSPAQAGYWQRYVWDNGWAAIWYNSDGTIGREVGWTDGTGHFEYWFSCCW